MASRASRVLETRQKHRASVDKTEAAATKKTRRLFDDSLPPVLCKMYIDSMIEHGLLPSENVASESESESEVPENSDGDDCSVSSYDGPRFTPYQWGVNRATLSGQSSNADSMYREDQPTDRTGYQVETIDQSPPTEQIPQIDQVMTVIPPDEPSLMADSTPSSVIPSNKTWPGKYDFNIEFQEQPVKMTKSTSWTYSESLEKLFINMGFACIVSFKVGVLPPSGCIIRALPIFEKSDHIKEIVKRCPTHSQLSEMSNQGHSAPEHLVRCDNTLAQYTTDNSGRQSVVVPFEPPQAGADNSEYLYKFMCFGSCVGGLNRRPLMLIFTLERNGEVLGRRPLRVRICACPGRDRKAEERNLEKKMGNNSTVTGTSRAVNQTTTTEIISLAPPPNKRLKTDSDDEIFTLTIKGRSNYEVLKKVRDALELADLVPREAVNAHRNEQQHMINSEARNALCGQSSTETVQPNRPMFVRTCSSTSSAARDGVAGAAVTNGPASRLTLVGEPSVSTSGAAPVKAELSSDGPNKVKTEPSETVESWLETIKMSAYTDVFTKHNLVNMEQLEYIDQDQLAKLNIGNAHRNVIWNALQEHRGFLCDSQTSTFSGVSQTTTASGSTRPPYFQISRYRFKRVKSMKLADE